MKDISRAEDRHKPNPKADTLYSQKLLVQKDWEIPDKRTNLQLTLNVVAVSFTSTTLEQSK